MRFFAKAVLYVERQEVTIEADNLQFQQLIKEEVRKTGHVFSK